MDGLTLLLLLTILAAVVTTAAVQSLIRPIRVETPDNDRKKQWANRLSLLMLTVPALVIGIFVISRCLDVSPPPQWFWKTADRLWIATGVAGLLAGIFASHLTRWKGDELLLIVVHLLSIFFIGTLWYATNISWVGVP